MRVPAYRHVLRLTTKTNRFWSAVPVHFSAQPVQPLNTVYLVLEAINFHPITPASVLVMKAMSLLILFASSAPKTVLAVFISQLTAPHALQASTLMLPITDAIKTVPTHSSHMMCQWSVSLLVLLRHMKMLNPA